MTEPKEQLDNLVKALADSCADDQAVNKVDGHDLPSRKAVEEVLDCLLGVMFPGYIGERAVSKANLPYYFGGLLHRAATELTGQVERAMAYDCRMRNGPECDQCRSAAATAVWHLFSRLPALREILKADIKVALERDPAATSPDLVILCYPGPEAIATQRLAHELYQCGVPIIPRMWTERAHSRTGIDINPGASIGPGFFIDHGTGIVVGETAEIGANVTLYQGVTLGALAPAKGAVLRGKKRHPTLEDGVIVYAGATILGGDTTIGRNSVIGGNVWLTSSVPPDTKVMTGKADLVFKPKADRKQ